MNITELMGRSKRAEEEGDSVIACANSADPLVAVNSSRRLIVEPIWEKPIDDIEGPLYQVYIKDHPSYNKVFVRQKVLERLLKAAESLPERYTLIVRAGHRPLDVQIRLLKGVMEEFARDYPQATRDQALQYARTFVSDPEIKLPPHCCGAAVDVDLLDAQTGQLVDFGCPVNTASDVAFLHSDTITEEQRTNRMFLLKAMLAGGLVSNYHEWWHYSYGDYRWARFYNKPAALYGLIEPKL